MIIRAWNVIETDYDHSLLVRTMPFGVGGLLLPAPSSLGVLGCKICLLKCWRVINPQWASELSQQGQCLAAVPLVSEAGGSGLFCASYAQANHLIFLLQHAITSAFCYSMKIQIPRQLGGSVVEHLRLAQGLSLRSWDRVSHWAPFREPASPPAYVSASLCVSLMNK